MIILNGATIPSFVKVNKVGFSILPPIENKLLQARGKKGSYFMNQDLGTREITVAITIISEEINGVMGDTRLLAEWLYHEKPVTLVVADEPDKSYMVLPSGDTKLDELANYGTGEITFVCTEPFAYGAEKSFTYSPVDETPFEVFVNGSTETHGVFELTMKQNVSEIHLISDDGFVTVGKATSVDETVIDAKPLQVHDQMQSLTGWTTGISVDGGAITGEMESTGYAFRPKTYGTGSTWHGSALVKTLPATLKDFDIDMDFTLDASKDSEVVRVELYLYDANNNVLGKIALADKTANKTSQTFEARVGTLQAGKYFVQETGYAWTNFTGQVSISRVGKTWTAWIGKYDSVKKQYHSRMTKTWVDKTGVWGADLAKVQVHIGGHGTLKAPTSGVYISDLKIYNRLTLATGQAPIIAKVGDTITVDNERAIVLKNGKPFYEGLHPDSKFFGLKQGANGIVLSPASADVSVSFKERWL